MLKKWAFYILLLSLTGCGYTNKITLPYGDAATIYVGNFKNRIPPENILTYVAGLESSVTNAVIDGLAKDGNLKLADQEDADLILQGAVTGYEQEGFRFNRFEQVAEFRLFIVVALKLIDAKTDKVIWEEKAFSGDTQYFVEGNREITEETAAEKAIADLAAKIVDRIVESW